MVLSLAKTEGNQGLGAAAAHCRSINSRMSGIGSAIRLLAIVAGRVQSGLVARSYHYRRTPPVCHGSGFLSGCIPFLPTLVPRLCLGTHCLRGSASRGGASGTVRSQAEPGNEARAPDFS